MDTISQARGRILIRHAFFGTLLMSTPLVETRDIPTAATDMDKIYYNPDFFAGLNVEQIMFVLAHEVMHIALEHGLRLSGRNPVMFNVAADYAINPILVESQFKFVEGCLLDKKYENMSADQIYELLRKEVEQKQQGGQGDKSQPGQGSSQPGQGEQGDKQDPNGGYTGPQDILGRDIKGPQNMDAEGMAKAERSIQQRVAAAASVARAAGQLSGNLERLVNNLLHPQVPWPELLREYMTRIVQDDESWSRRNRRFNHVYLPARHSVRMKEFIVIGDTSGSITQQDLDKVAAEVNAVADLVRPERIRAVWADTKVKHEEVFEQGDELKLKPMGGGGTDMRVPLRYVEQYDPEVVVMITDGYTPWITEPTPYPLIVCCTTDVVLDHCDMLRLV